MSRVFSFKVVLFFKLYKKKTKFPLLFKLDKETKKLRDGFKIWKEKKGYFSDSEVLLGTKVNFPGVVVLNFELPQNKIKKENKYYSLGKIS